MTRYRAAFIHLMISASIAAIVLVVMLALWYPPPWFAAMGGRHLIFLMIGVDVCLGPLMTLVVFNTAKKSLKFDLAVIGVVQLAALVYGAHVMFVARPAYAVFVVDQFNAVTANELEAAELAQAKYPEFRHVPLTGPKIVAADLPKDQKARERLMFASLFGGIDIQQIPKYYVPYEQRRSEALARAKPLTALRKLDSANAAVLDAWLKKSGRNEASLRYLPMRAKHADMAALLDAGTGDVVGLLPLRGWD